MTASGIEVVQPINEDRAHKEQAPYKNKGQANAEINKEAGTQRTSQPGKQTSKHGDKQEQVRQAQPLSLEALFSVLSRWLRWLLFLEAQFSVLSRFCCDGFYSWKPPPMTACVEPLSKELREGTQAAKTKRVQGSDSGPALS